MVEIQYETCEIFEEKIQDQLLHIVTDKLTEQAKLEEVKKYKYGNQKGVNSATWDLKDRFQNLLSHVIRGVDHFGHINVIFQCTRLITFSFLGQTLR